MIWREEGRGEKGKASIAHRAEGIAVRKGTEGGGGGRSGETLWLDCGIKAY